MTPYYSATVLHVSDVDRSIQYYTDVLSFTLEFRYRDLAGLEYGPVLIYLSGPGQDVKKNVGEGSVYVVCDEVDEYYKQIQQKSDAIFLPLESRPYGMTDFAIQDPDGNILTFGTSV